MFEVGSGKWEVGKTSPRRLRASTPSPNRWERGWMLTDAGEDDEGAFLGKALTPPRRCGGDPPPCAGEGELCREVTAPQCDLPLS